MHRIGAPVAIISQKRAVVKVASEIMMVLGEPCFW